MQEATCEPSETTRFSLQQEKALGKHSAIQQPDMKLQKRLVEDPEKFGISHEKKKSLTQKQVTYEGAVNDAIRASFTYIVYATRGGKIEAKSFRPSGYGTAQPGQEILWHVLAKVLHRVTDESLDPEYAKAEAWPAQAQETTTRAFFENIHKKTGTVLPEDQSLFEKTIMEGVNRSSWVLIQQDKAYTQENLPSHVTISSDSRLLLPEEAGRQDFTDSRGHLCSGCSNWPCQCKKDKPQPASQNTLLDEREPFNPNGKYLSQPQ